ncbi:MAG: antibiotic biosynthesis monooxygenase [Frankiales bacterium]|nr:antibiotic biosynthesis monooxygenase [Frankiales bacterium]
MGHTVPVEVPEAPALDAVLPGRIGLLVRMPVQPGLRAAALDVLNRYVDDLDEEPGTEAFFLCVDPDDADVIWLYEWFRDEAALEAHRSAPLFGRLMAELPGLVVDGTGIMRLDPLRLRMSPAVTVHRL